MSDDPERHDSPLPTTVLGIDPGLAHFAAVVLDVSPTGVRVRERLHVASTPDSGTDAERMDAIGLTLWRIALEHVLDVIGYEGQAGMAGNVRQNASSRRLLEVCGMVRMLAVQQGTPLYVVAPATLKVAVLGKGGGRASKAAVQERVQTLLGWRDGNQHECDAAACALATYGKHRTRRRTK